ncbi:MAG TPA: ABC transporter permease, partial [Geminicoccaceae bacterium]|nr:ABC transporter permease [Geminicoccaceae bacterium]
MLRPAGTLLRLLATLALTFLGLLVVTFLIGRVVPVDPVLAAVGARASPAVYARVRAEIALQHALQEGDLGQSVLTARPVLDDI